MKRQASGDQNKYLQEFILDNELSHTSPAIFCLHCFNKFTTFCNLKIESLLSLDKLNNIIESEKTRIEQLYNTYTDIQCYKVILMKVLDYFNNQKPLLLLDLNKEYTRLIVESTDNLSMYHNSRWLYTMLKSSFGKFLSVYTPENKKTGRMIYYTNSNILNSLYNILLSSSNLTTSCTDKECNSNISFSTDGFLQELKDKFSSVAGSCVSSFPDISSIDIYDEIKKIQPFSFSDLPPLLQRIKNCPKKLRLDNSLYSIK